MAGKRSKQKKGQKQRRGASAGGGSSKPRNAAAKPRQEDEYQGTMMSMRSGFKRVAQTDGGKGSSGIWNLLTWVAAGVAVVFLVQKFAC